MSDKKPRWTRLNSRRYKTSRIKQDDTVYKDVMWDIETLGKKENTAVLSLGAVKFNLGTIDDAANLTMQGRTFYARFDELEQQERGRTVDEDTLEWWDKEAGDLANEVFDEERKPVRAELLRFIRWLGPDASKKYLWGNGPSFDNKIMRDLMAQYDVEVPGGYWMDRCCRTIKDMWNRLCSYPNRGKAMDVGIENTHNALDDAKMQTLQVQRMYRDIRGTKYGT